MITALMFIGGAQAQQEFTSLDQLEHLQTEVQKVVKKTMPATISLMSPRGSSGSAVIISKEGLVLTAAHVVQGAKEMTVVFPNGKQAKAKVLGMNYSKDAAICQMVGKGPWPFAEVGESKDLKIGQFVVAMGHAGGFDAIRTPPVRFGRVLSKNPNAFVTTDCTLIGGDSGGPLFDLDGKVVGIHSNIGQQLKANNHAGLSGFKADWDRMLKGDIWGRLSMNPMTNPDSPVIGIEVGQPKDGGIVIARVMPRGPADKSGLKGGDVIMKVAGRAVKNRRQLIGEIMKNNAGEEVELELKRDGKEMKLKLKLGRRGEMENDFKEK